ncbi:demethylmenaquinone methyltransferase [Chengkuizengella axinellae]|uniref:Demethylmenaquinone methyltransferase n=1 Tax=Chengkuizengella axinellae TaxID=3064388 RepID=A0ABT9IWR6_9BACL|nr:demethylmenaquinone methyltransferase [Chengkuizengella sp. 2205SS18-9]MDP5273796.1 demethylmenaquinone methyltransferase [Chengkuizengella sp. 2205SS18-9]
MEGNAKKEFVHSVFENIAPKYDIMNDIISFRRHKAWRKFTMKKMNIKTAETAIDICCGTCDWTISMAEESKAGKIVGLDFSQNMLDVGRRKVESSKLDNQIELVHGDAMDLPFDDNSFDYATIGLALRNVPDLRQVLSEMRRVVKPGGQVYCLELSKPTWQPFKSIYYFYFNRILPLIGKLVAKSYEQYKWLPESLITFPDHKELAKIFEEVGLNEVKAYPLTGGIAALHIGTKGKSN